MTLANGSATRPALICASMAFDSIMSFPDRFKHHILPHELDILSVSFVVPTLRREFGGCAGNIAYNLKLLGGNPVPVGTVGRDFAPYREHFEQLGIAMSHITELDDAFTAQAFITTDEALNQITAFHPGAMGRAGENPLTETGEAAIGLVGPDGAEAMLHNCDALEAAGIPVIFDPGQALPLFNADQLDRMVSKATYLIVNDYEAHLLRERLDFSDRDLSARVDAYVVTRGPEGATLHVGDDTQHIPVVKASQVVDPTGCGDAFRAGFIYALLDGKDFATACRLGSVMGAVKIEHLGPQNHLPSPDQILSRYQETFSAQF